MNYESILIVTYGRSGSTLLQGVLNTIDGCFIRGENMNFCRGLYQSYLALRLTRDTYGEAGECHAATSPWFGAAQLNLERFLQDARSMLLHQLMGDRDEKPRCVGFKEIRYFGMPAGELHGYLDFLAELLPRPAFLFLTRDHDEVSRSGWWAFQHPELLKARLEEFEDAIGNYRSSTAGTFFLDYSDLAPGAIRLRNLHAFLGVPYRPERVERVLGVRHSFRLRNPCTVRWSPEAGRWLDRLSLDPMWPEPRKPFALTGVAVLNRHELQRVCRLECEDASGRRAAEWEISSAHSGELLPAETRLRSAGFRLDDVVLEDNKPIRLVLVRPSGQECELLTVSLRS
ncbi:MAG TPA: sulfotransferase [Gammaproteobacteria bacterium]